MMQEVQEEKDRGKNEYMKENKNTERRGSLPTGSIDYILLDAPFPVFTHPPKPPTLPMSVHKFSKAVWLKHPFLV
jgi:hypothetical protein